MITATTRDEMEKMLGKALSRHIGHTTAAYDLDRIFSVLNPFANTASVYGAELINFLKIDAQDGSARMGAPKKDLEESYLEGIVTMAEAMGIIQAVSQKEARVKRFAATELGRSILGAQATSDPDFYDYYLAKIVILTDADAIFAVMSYFEAAFETSLIEYYLDFSAKLRESRLSWLISAFPEQILLERILKYVPWIKLSPGAKSKYFPVAFTENTARHHATPRKGWLYRLGMLDRTTDRLTTFGQNIFHALAPNGSYFWLGPPEGLQEKMKISPSFIVGPFEDQFNFSNNYYPPSNDDVNNLVESLTTVMISAYSSAKLVHAAQASLSLPIEYIQFRSHVDGKAYRWQDVLNVFFHSKRDHFERLSAIKGQVGFFKVKAGGA